MTHYQRLLNYIVPDFVHIMIDGRIIRSGGKELALEVEDKGYDWLREEATWPVQSKDVTMADVMMIANNSYLRDFVGHGPGRADRRGRSGCKTCARRRRSASPP